MTNKTIATPEQVSKPADGKSELNARLAAYVIRAVRYVLDPLILKCFGWKYESEYCMGRKFYCWIDPIDGKRYDQSKAIEKCESRL